MNILLRKLALNIMPVLLLGFLVASCKEDEPDLAPMRMFTPAGGIKTTSGETQVKLTWNRSLYTSGNDDVTYTVEVAADTLFETPVVLSVQTDTAGVVLTDEQLEVRQKYFARVKANALGDRPESKYWEVSSSFSIRGMQILSALMGSDITDKGVLLKWRPTPGLTNIVLTPVDGGDPVAVAVAEDDLAANQKLVQGLQASTTYKVEIFKGTRVVGYLTFTTNEPVVGNIIDLTGFANRPSVLEDTLTQVESGSIIVLKKGMTYTISNTVTLDRSVTIMSENTVNPEKAKIAMSSNFTMAEGSQVDSVVFKDVLMQGNDYGGAYVFNIDKAATVGTIKFEGSHMEIFRGISRIKTSGVTVDNFVVSNSVVDSVANYGVLTVDNSGAKVNHIVFSNSTFYKIERPIVSKSAAMSILISNCTFNDAPEAGRYLIDFNSNDVTGGITIQNTILGRGKAVGEDTGVKGARASSATLVSASNSYATSDYNVSGNEIPGLTVYSGSATDLFKDPKNGNFTIKDASFAGAGSAGDPRWRP